MRYPSARSVRAAKNLCVVLPLLTFLFGMLFITVKYGDHTPRHNRRKVRKETLEEVVERTGVCDQLNLTVSANGTAIMPTHVGGLNQTVVGICKWLKETTVSYYRPSKEKVRPYNHSFIIHGKDICDKDTEIIVLVHSLHDYHEKRKAIRTTWGEAVQQNKWPHQIPIKAKVKVAFVFGLHPKNKSWHDFIKREDDIHHDIIQGDFYEHYHNMTLKSLLGLKWVLQYCPSAKLLVKSDDDMIINWPYLLEEMEKENMTRAIMGPYNEGSRVYRTGKWKIPKSEFPFNFYPPYESGSAYIINTDLILELYAMSEYVPHIFIDDVYITGILAKIIGAQHIKHSGFAFWTDKRPSSCHILKNWIITGTKMKPEILIELWQSILDTYRTQCPENMPTNAPQF